ncbi:MULTISPECIES: glycoside hydrolase family 43 protein [Kribbella]|uniref:Glycoside hydrolase 43 family protein n=1 Tax=Kribbella karoonensis TaxID=324851 RepID=A0ABN2E3T9_9ACTN
MPGTTATYRNPIIDADYSDPDAVRVGDDFWMVASSFTMAPGLPILHSTDLVHWKHVANALPRLEPAGHFALTRPGGGVWAPSIRYHDGRFVIVYPDPDHGIFVVTATDPRGPWTAPTAVLPGRGRIDPCLLWDDDGRVQLVHGWAESRAGFKNRLTVIEVSADLSGVVGPAVDIVDGGHLSEFATLEGPKLYKRDGWYWIFAPAGGVATGWQLVFRSRHLHGPYEHRTVLAQGNTEVNGPHQGAWVDTPTGQDWFLHFQDRGPIGRVVHLQPMTWDADGWPELGERGPDGVGQPVVVGASPDVAEQDGPVRRLPYGTDDFGGPLAPQWAWYANPDTAWSAGPADGLLTLHAVADDAGDLRELGHILGQRLPGQPASLRTTLYPDRMSVDGSRAGVVLLGSGYVWLGVIRTGGTTLLTLRRSGAPGTPEVVLAVGPPVSGAVRLCLRTDGESTAHASWALDDGGPWHELDGELALTAGRWVGTRVGLFASSPLGSTAAGAAATFGPLEVVVDGTEPPLI